MTWMYGMDVSMYATWRNDEPVISPVTWLFFEVVMNLLFFCQLMCCLVMMNLLGSIGL